MPGGAFLSWRPAKASESRRSPALLVIDSIVMLALVAIIPLVYASPGDPTWIAGMYDGADYDDIVSLLADTSAALSSATMLGAMPFAPVEVGAFALVVGIALFLALRLRSPPTDTVRITSQACSPPSVGRAPPALCSTSAVMKSTQIRPPGGLSPALIQVP